MQVQDCKKANRRHCDHGTKAIVSGFIHLQFLNYASLLWSSERRSVETKTYYYNKCLEWTHFDIGRS